MTNNSQSREFFDLVKSIGECRSKQEEDRIIENEIIVLKSKFSAPKKNLSELLVRSIYVEMLGHDAQFAYIHGVNMCHDKSLVGKRIGYLVCCLFLSPESELMFLLINTIQKDLKSSNLLEISFALIAVSKLVTAEMVPALTALVGPLLTHSSAMIRRRAMIAFHRMVQLSDTDDVHAVIRRSLVDSDPGVMAVGLNPIWDLAKSDPNSCRNLLPSLVNILGQIIDHKLPRDFDYHRMPAPWIQIRLVAILGLLAENDQAASNLIYDVIGETMRRADLGSNAGTAVVFEVIKTATKIVPNHSLLEHASLIVSKFLAPEASHNFKYLGVTCLSKLVAVNPSYATAHQLRVVVCLDDDDETLRRQTLDLLFKMTNHTNVAIVVERMLSQMKISGETVFKKSLGDRIFQLAEQFAPSNEWYLQTVNQVYAADVSDCFDPSVAHNLTRLVAQQDEEDSTVVDLRMVAANEYILLLENFVGQTDNSFSPGFLQLIVWMIGEFATLNTLDGYKTEDVIDLLQDGVKRLLPQSSCLVFFVAALLKLAVISGYSIDKFLEWLAFETTCVAVQERCREAEFILTLPRGMQKSVLPFDASCEDIDLSFNFLDEYTNQAKRNGAKEYKKQAVDPAHAVVHQPKTMPLRFEAYSPPPARGTHTHIEPVPLKSPPAEVVDMPPQLHVSTNKWGPKVTISAIKTQEVTTIQAPQPTRLPTVVPEVTQPRENLEQQRIAAALFSGLPAGKTESRWGKKKTEPKDDLLEFAKTSSETKRKDSQISDLLG